MMRRMICGSLLLVLAAVLAVYCGKTLTDKELFDQGMSYYNEGKYAESEKAFNKLVETYPASEQRAKTIFLLGFINSNQTNNKTQAEKYYKMMVEQYPDCTLTVSARFELEMINKTPAEIDSILLQRFTEPEKTAGAQVKNQPAVKK